jgi:hypothetical protein
MGWKTKGLGLFLGVVFFGLGAWPLGLVCFLLLALSLRPGPRPGEKRGARHHVGLRVPLAVFLFILSAMALGSRGALSPAVFFTAGAAVLSWPAIARVLPIWELEPVGDSVLMRSKYVPFLWCSVAELKPGEAPFPLGASAFTGRLMAFTDTGRTYSLVSCRALGRREAEARLLAAFRLAAPSGRGACFLLPLDATSSADLLKLKLSPKKYSPKEFVRSVATFSGLLVIECQGGTVSRGSIFAIEGPGKFAALPDNPKGLNISPLTWEVFDAVGKRTRWPDPDRYSDLLDSMLATRGAPFAERLSQLESSGDGLTVRSLAGDELSTTRSQLRAILTIYS